MKLFSHKRNLSPLDDGVKIHKYLIKKYASDFNQIIGSTLLQALSKVQCARRWHDKRESINNNNQF